MHVNRGLRGFEVINIRCSYLADLAGVTGYELSELSAYLECTRGLGINPGYLVQRVAEPLHIGSVVEVHTPYQVRQRLVTRVDLCRQGFLVQVHQRTAYHKVFIKLVL